MITIIAALLATSHAIPSDDSEKLRSYMKRTDDISTYAAAQVDLDGDGRKETLVYETEEGFCGSGGCHLLVLTPHAGSYRIVGSSSIVQLPIEVLDTSGHGWRDLAVSVSGGGIRRAHRVRLRFDGRRYPTNPTMPPARPVKGHPGTVVIDDEMAWGRR